MMDELKDEIISDISLAEHFSLENHLLSTRTADLYRAIDTRSGQTVLLWMLRHTLSQNTASIRAFGGRLKVFQTLPQITGEIIDYGIDVGGIAFCTLKEPDGAPLEPKLIPDNEVDRVVQKCISLVSEIHNAGLVCGDISPGSFWYQSDGTIRFTGLMGSFDIEAQSTSAAPPMFTFHFLSPEQRSGSCIEPASDVYALGVLGYLLFTRRYPAGNEKSILMGHPHPSKIIPVTEIVPTAPIWVDEVFHRSLGHDPVARYVNAGQMLQAAIDIRKNAEENAQPPAEIDSEPLEPVNFGTNYPATPDESKVQSFSDIRTSAVGIKREQPSTRRPAWVLPAAGLGGMCIVLATVLLVYQFVSSTPDKQILSKIEVANSVAGLVAQIKEVSEQDIQKALVKALAERQEENVIHELIELARDFRNTDQVVAAEIEASIGDRLASQIGEKASSLFSAQLLNGDYDQSYFSALSIFDETLPDEQRIGYLRDTSAVAPRPVLQVLGLTSLIEDDKSPFWLSQLQELMSETLKLGNLTDYSAQSLVLVHPEISGLFSAKEQQNMVRKLDREEARWLLGVLTNSESKVFKLVARSVVDRNLLSSPESLLMKSIADDVTIPSRVREALISGALGTASVEDVSALDEWLSMKASEAIAAICASSRGRAVHEAAFESLSNRRVDIEPTKSLIHYLKKRDWANRFEYSRAVCKIGFYSQLNEKDQQEVVDGVGVHINDSGFLDIVFGSQNYDLISKLVAKHGQNLGPTLLLDLLLVPDSATKRSAIKHLRWYNDVLVFQKVKEAYNREENEDIRELYRESFWIIREMIKKKA